MQAVVVRIKQRLTTEDQVFSDLFRFFDEGGAKALCGDASFACAASLFL